MARFERGRVGVVEEGLPALRHDLPREAELVLQPPALALLAAVGGEGVPVVVDLGLVGAADLEGDGFVEGELRARR